MRVCDTGKACEMYTSCGFLEMSFEFGELISHIWGLIVKDLFHCWCACVCAHTHSCRAHACEFVWPCANVCSCSEARKGFESPGAGVAGACELFHMGTEIESWGPLKEHQALLIAEPSLHPQITYFKRDVKNKDTEVEQFSNLQYGRRNSKVERES